MTEALLVSTIALWATVVALALVVFALVRQVGVLHERVAPVGALSTAAGPKVGEAAPELTVRALDGGAIPLGGRRDDGASTFLFFVSPTCPVCKSLLPTVKKMVLEEGPHVSLVFASDGPGNEHEAFVREHDLEGYPYVLSTELGLAYQVAKLPYAVLIDGEGLLRAKGLVNTREHVESLFTATEHGVASIQEYVAKRGSGNGGAVAPGEEGS